nr:hypothetical protein GCM10023233_00730 [Brevibacterium otitidis]BFF08637.1 hypothetical protein GCM10023233_36060 [Brevibacterium otitidis]
MLAAVLGLAAAGLEQRINDEIDLRERLAIQHQRDLDYVRLKMALDTHDLMSHGLATEHAIMRMMGVDARAEGRHEERLTELALVNSHTQYQLRILLTRLTDNPRGRPHIGNLENEMTTAAEMVRLAANTGGYNVQIQLGTLACKASIDFIEIALFILKELATNAIKHAALPHSCSISVHIRQRGGQDWLHFNACNPSSDEPRHMPRSLTTRVDQAGGELRLRHSAGLLSVEVDVPVAAGDTK